MRLEAARGTEAEVGVLERNLPGDVGAALKTTTATRHARSTTGGVMFAGELYQQVSTFLSQSQTRCSDLTTGIRATPPITHTRTRQPIADIDTHRHTLGEVQR